MGAADLARPLATLGSRLALALERSAGGITDLLEQARFAGETWLQADCAVEGSQVGPWGLWQEGQEVDHRGEEGVELA